MLDAAEKNWLIEELGATMELAGQQIRPAALALLVSDLDHVPKQLLRVALARIRAEHKGAILSGTVLQYVDHAMGRLLPAEAYALALSGRDERATLIWNDEICAAWGVAAPLMDAGDKFAARQAFIEAYGRITGEARATRKRPELLVSLGHSAEGRARALTEAMAAGRLPGGVDALPEDVRDALALPAPRDALALPAPERADSAVKAEALAKFAALRSMLTRGLPRAKRIQRVRAWQDRRRTRALKAKASANVAAYLDGAAPCP
jgi:hypothetical protein